MKRGIIGAVVVAAGLAASGCGPGPSPTPDGGTDGGGNQNAVPQTYAFTAQGGTESSVNYTGQTFRHVLIEELKGHIGGLTAKIDSQQLTPVAGDIKNQLNFFYAFDGATAGDVALTLSTMPAAKQAAYKDLSAGGASLTSKIAGKDDPEKQHKNWATDLKGWAGQTSPEGLVLHWFDQLDQLAVDRANSNIPKDPSGADITKVFVTEDGVDLQQIIQKFLGGAVALSQAADDYLDEGLSADNTQKVTGKPYTELEHAWDEGFGYFGAARDYLKRTDAEIAASPAHDTDGDGKIDLLTEYSYGHSQNAAKRDNGSAASATTDFSGQAMKAFLEGRALITNAGGALSAEQKTKLEGLRDQAVLAWEKAIAASVIHYINDVLADMGKFGTADYKFLDHAKHWSELKGFALSLQFNPRSPLSAAQFEALHQKLGDAPVLPNQSGITEYKTALQEARTILKEAYGFAQENIGDANGQGGW